MTADPIIVYVAHEYPPKTQTFVAAEAEALRQLGRDVLLFPMHKGPEGCRTTWVINWRNALTWSCVRELPRVLACLGKRWRAAATQLSLPPRGVKQFARSSKAILMATALASVVRARAGSRPVHLQAHFFGLMSEVALLARCMLDDSTTVGITGHAGDVVNPRSSRRLIHESESADFVVCSSEFVKNALVDSGSSATVDLIHCGIPEQEGFVSRLDGEMGVVRIAAVARLVEKKGIDIVLRALHLLAKSSSRRYEAIVVGDGPERDRLTELAGQLGLNDNVDFRGPCPPAELLPLLRTQCDIFVSPSRVASDGDIDGIPVVLSQAMSLGLPVITTAVSGIPELVSDGRTGFIVPTEDPGALAACLEKAAESPVSTQRIGIAGREFVRAHFSQSTEAARLWKMVATVQAAARHPNLDA